MNERRKNEITRKIVYYALSKQEGVAHRGLSEAIGINPSEMLQYIEVLENEEGEEVRCSKGRLL